MSPPHLLSGHSIERLLYAFARRCLLVASLLLGIGGPATSAEAAEPATARITLQMVATHDGNPIWLLNSAPSGSAVDLPDELKSSFESALEKSSQSRYFTTLKTIDAWAQQNGVKLTGGYTPEKLVPPTQEERGKVKAHTLSFQYTYSPPPPKIIKRVEIYLTSSTAKTGARNILTLTPVPEINPASKSVHFEKGTSLAQFEKDYDIVLRPDKEPPSIRQNITAGFVFTDEDVRKYQKAAGGSLENAKKELEKQYRELAVLHALSFYDQGLRPGTEYNKTRVTTAATAASAEVTRYIVPPSPAEFHEETGTLRFLYADVALPAVSVNLPADDSRQGKFSQRYLSGRDALVTHPTRLPQAAAIKADIEFLQENPQVKSASFDWLQAVDGQGPGFRFDVIPKTQILREGTVTLEAAYSEEKKQTGSVTVDFSDATLAKDTLRLSLEAGESSISGDGEVVIPLPTKNENEWSLALRASAEDRDDAYFGNILRPAVDAKTTTAEAGVLWHGDTVSHRDEFEARRIFNKDRKRLKHLIAVESGIRYTDVNLDGEAAALAGLDEGDAVGPYLKADYRGEYDGRIASGLERWHRLILSAELDIDTGLAPLGGSDDFVRTSFSSDAWGIFQQNDEVAGYVLAGITGGWASSGTPTYQAFGAGGSPFIRGLHQDEFIGRTYLGARVETGVNLIWLASHHAKKSAGKKDEPAPDKTGEEPKPDKQVFLGIFADVGVLGDRIRDGVEVSGNQGLQGYGIQLQVLDGTIWNHVPAFAIGYAWSPQSDLHRSGTIFTRIFYDF